MKRESGFVSVLIPVNDDVEGFLRAIDSVYAQSYLEYEVIVVDDSLNESVYQVLEANYGEKTNLIYVANDTAAGLMECYNIGSAYASGDYLAFLACDTVWEDKKLEKQMKILEVGSFENNAVYCCTKTIYDNGTEIEDPDQRIKRELCCGYMYPYLLMFPIVDLTSLIIKKEVFEELGGIQADLGILSDYEFVVRMSHDVNIDFVDEIMVERRRISAKDRACTENTIFTQCYIIGTHYQELVQLNQLTEKLDFVRKSANIYKCMDLFIKCLETLEQPLIDEYLINLKAEISNAREIQMFEENNIANVKACCGCMACVNSCHVGAIKFIMDENGFLMPQVDENKCIKCGKCKAACPLCNDMKGELLPERCLAVMANDEIRMNSSSGGVFPLLAEAVLQESGFVAGAVWDENLHVKHILSNKIEEVKRMYSSKYVQSNIGNVFVEIKQVLENGSIVLFSGTACQVAGLKQYLGKDYVGLYTIDVVCHGVPSPGVFGSYLNEKGTIKEISFRDKRKMGWKSGTVLRHQDDREEVLAVHEDVYMSAFLNNWSLRESCYNCQFKSQKYSDITLGDFWGINQISEFDDGLGTSFVTLNTEKGVILFGKIVNRIKKSAQTDIEHAIKYNPCIVESVRKNKIRDIFFSCYDKKSLVNTVKKLKQEIRFDAALVYMWSNNYGNALTNYALYTYLTQKGMNLLALDNMSTLRPEKDMRRFAQQHYNLSSEYFNDYAYNLVNECCDSFIVGSDQNWNYLYESAYGYGRYFQLDFVGENKKRFSYATSFGRPNAAIPPELGGDLYRKFDVISVREDFGVDVCHDLYGVEAVRVLDPVFLLSAKEYDVLLKGMSNECEEPYILVYVLNPTEKKIRLFKEIQKRLGGIRLITVLDNSSVSIHYNKKVYNYENIITSLTVEQWLNYIKNSSFVITDSYHGMCFSIIFRKTFLAIKNRERYRFATFEKYSEFKNRILDDVDNWMLDEWTKELDYDKVKDLLNEEIHMSKQFIENEILQNSLK